MASGVGRWEVSVLMQPRTSVPSLSGVNQAPCGMAQAPVQMRSVTTAEMRTRPRSLKISTVSPVRIPRGAASCGWIHRMGVAAPAGVPADHLQRVARAVGILRSLRAGHVFGNGRNVIQLVKVVEPFGKDLYLSGRCIERMMFRVLYVLFERDAQDGVLNW